MKHDHFFRRVLALVLTIVAVLAGQSARAMSSFTVTNPTGSTFRITRTGNTSVSETVNWRVVSLTAIAGVHFSGYNGDYSGSVTFNEGVTYVDIPISELNPSGAYIYKTPSSAHKYCFEILDRNGDILGSVEHEITNDTTVPSNMFGMKTGKIYAFPFSVEDNGYNQSGNPRTIGRSSFYDDNEQSYLSFLNAPLHMTLEIQAKEEDDAYEYLQVLIDNTTECDNVNSASNGNPGTPDKSCYMAGFEMDLNSTYTTYQTYTFPVPNVEDGTKADDPWGYGTAFPLWMQKFKSGSCSSDYKIIVPNNFSTISVRFDASGSSGSDKWWVNYVDAKLTAIDGTRPTVLDNYKVSGAPHQKGNTIYVSVAFSEIVIVSGQPTLSTSWGDLKYIVGGGTNVLTFSGTIDSNSTGTFSVTGYSGTIMDLAGNIFDGTISHNFGTTLDPNHVWSTSDFREIQPNTYEIASNMDLRHLRLMMKEGYDQSVPLVFKQTRAITCDVTFNPISGFSETYDGSNCRIFIPDSPGKLINGFFGSVNGGTVKNVILAEGNMKGGSYVGGIVGRLYNGGTVEGCGVESAVTINAVSDRAYNLGGVVGSIEGGGRVIGCFSAASISSNDKSSVQKIGGIVGSVSDGSVTHCFYKGNTVSNVTYSGAIAGYVNNCTFTNNYYSNSGLPGAVNGSDQDGARRGYIVTFDDDAKISFLGIHTLHNTTMDIGNFTMYFGRNYYSGEGQTPKLQYSGVPSGYAACYAVNGTPITGNTFTMPANDVNVSAVLALVLADNAANNSIISNNTGSDKNVVLTGRTLFKDGAWNTLCLPFPLTISGSVLDGATVMELDTEGTYDTDKHTGFDATSGTLYLYFKSVDAIEAGKPYIVKWASGSSIENPVFTGVTIDNGDEAIARMTVGSADGKVSFIGNYDPVNFDANDKTKLFLGGGNNLYWPEDNITIGAFRAYFQFNNGLSAGNVNAQNVKMFFGEGTETGLFDVRGNTEEVRGDNTIYNLAGQRLQKAQRGVNIINGRKVVIK